MGGGQRPRHPVEHHQAERASGHVDAVAHRIGAQEAGILLGAENIDQGGGVDTVHMLGIEGNARRLRDFLVTQTAILAEQKHFLLLVAQLPPGPRRALAIAVDLLVFGFLAVIAWLTIGYTIESWDNPMPSLRWPYSIHYAGAALGLIAMAALQTLYGLWPLRELRQAIANMRQGKTQRVAAARLPNEVAPLVDELNGLLDHNERQDLIRTKAKAAAEAAEKARIPRLVPATPGAIRPVATILLVSSLAGMLVIRRGTRAPAASRTLKFVMTS